MASPEHQKILRKGTDAWNAWRRENKEVVPNLSRVDFSDADLSDANLSKADLSGADLSEVRLTGAILSDANLSKANLRGADFSETNLSGSNLSGSDLSRAKLTRSALIGANLSGANLTSANLRGAHFSNANLSGAKLSKAYLRGANLCGANLSEADLSLASLSEADLSLANLSEANLSEANLSEANLARADLARANLSKANLSGVDLSLAKLIGAYLIGTDLIGANLSLANLSNAILIEANLNSANFGGADLSGADLSSARLKGVLELTQDQLNLIRFDPTFPPHELHKGFALPDGRRDAEILGAESDANEDAGEGVGALPGDGDSEVLRAHPSDRIISSGQLNTPTARFRREASQYELMQLLEMLNSCEAGVDIFQDRSNVIRLGVDKETLDLLKTIVKTAYELHQAPNYPEGLVAALIGIGTALRFFQASSDLAPLPKLLSDRIARTVTAYDGFLTELGLI